MSKAEPCLQVGVQVFGLVVPSALEREQELEQGSALVLKGAAFEGALPCL